MRLVHRHDGRSGTSATTRTSSGDVRRIRENYSDQEIVEALSDTIKQLEEYRKQFDADDHDAVSRVEASQDMATEDAWEALSDWKTLESRAAPPSTRRGVITQLLVVLPVISMPDN